MAQKSVIPAEEPRESLEAGQLVENAAGKQNKTKQNQKKTLSKVK